MSHDSSLEPVLQAVEPALRLVHERYLRQILNFLIDRGRTLPTNTDLPFWFTRADLAAAAVLPRDALRGTEPRLLLVTDPTDRLISGESRGEQFRAYWRALFRAAVMNAIDQNLATGALTAERCRDQLNRFGPAAGREIRFVLESERFAAPGASDADVFRTFAALYLDLDCFTPRAPEAFFPSLPHGGAVRAALVEDLPADALLAGSRPAGATDPERDPNPVEVWTAPPPGTVVLPPTVAEGGVARLRQKAAEAEQKGNVVRAAILYAQAAAVPGADVESAKAASRAALRLLVTRLGDVLEWDADTREEWHQALGPLVPRAAIGIWPRAARCLYELQRIPADFSRDVYAVDVPEYIRTFGNRPVRRLLPRARPVQMLMAFRTAHKQLLRAGLGERELMRLDRLLHHEMHRREHAIRHEFTPIIVSTLTAAGLVPANRVELVARDKLVAELLDRVCARGYLRIGDLRDAVARNQLKLADLHGAGEFIGGDALLRADTGLAYALDGVYRRGEFYLRWIQRFASLFFGTPWGRVLTLYLALPFGGAFLTLMFAEELKHMGGKVVTRVSRAFAPKPGKPPPPPIAPVPTPAAPVPVPVVPPPPTAPPPERARTDEEPPEPELARADADVEPELEQPVPDEKKPIPVFIWENKTGREEIGNDLKDIFTSSKPKKAPESFPVAVEAVLALGTFFLLVLHVPPFRRAVVRALGYLWYAVRTVLWDVPGAVWASQPFRAIRLSGTALFLRRHCATPLVLSVLLLAVLSGAGLNPLFLAWYGWAVFVGLVVLYNLPIGVSVQDRIADLLSAWWRRLRTNFVPGLLGWILDGFRALANWVERQLYAVDEWMRFRGGDSQGSLVLKAVLGLVWFPVAYAARFAFYLLIEPQINPLKHFPVVTVSHKVMLPLVVTEHPKTDLSMFGEVLATQFGFSIPEANFWGFWIIAGIPGIFGFIAWELKENWRMYAANRSPVLPPVSLGSHGESMRGLLRPGFHSGTVPKIYRKARNALTAANRARATSAYHELDHASEGVYRFAERDLVPLLTGCRDWSGVAVEVAAVRFGVQTTEVELAAPALGPDPFVLAFENIDGRIAARVVATGWADKLTDAQRGALVYALRGLLDMAAAATFDDRARTPSAAEESGFGALVRPVTWDEWVKHWGEPAAPAQNGHHS